MSPLICSGAVTVIVVVRTSLPVQASPQSGQSPSGYDAISAGVSTKFPQFSHCTTSVEVEGDHFEPSGMFITVSDITTPYVILTVTPPTLEVADRLVPVKEYEDAADVVTEPKAEVAVAAVPVMVYSEV